MNFYNIFKYTDIRIQQQKKEKIIDQKLHILNSQCPNIISKYLLTYRSINRFFTIKLQNTSYLNYPIILAESLEYLDNHQNEVEQVLDSCYPCLQLENMIKKYEKNIN